MWHGVSGAYRWFESSSLTAGALLDRCPEVWLGKYAAITSIDSGPMVLSDDEMQGGWTEAGGVAYSPRLVSLEHVPSTEYEEVYFFACPTILGDVEEFVNYFGFSLRDPSGTELEDFLREAQKRFWHQMDRLAPESYVAEGDSFIYATRNEQLYSIAARLSGPSG